MIRRGARVESYEYVYTAVDPEPQWQGGGWISVLPQITHEPASALRVQSTRTRIGTNGVRLQSSFRPTKAS